jgi:hypothetical protein
VEWIAFEEEMGEDDEFEMVHRGEAEFDKMDGVRGGLPPFSKNRKWEREEYVGVSLSSRRRKIVWDMDQDIPIHRIISDLLYCCISRSATATCLQGEFFGVCRVDYAAASYTTTTQPTATTDSARRMVEELRLPQ